MFTGIIQAVLPIIKVIECEGDLKVQVEKTPNLAPAFADLKTGDSVALDGICLTLENISETTMSFHLGHETLKVTGWNKDNLLNQKVNLEPALRLQDFVGGHLVAGHIDGMAKVFKVSSKGAGMVMDIAVDSSFKKFIWKKAFITLNGVSLTLNEIKKGCELSVCLVPETLKRTNFTEKKAGDLLTFEIDYWSRALVSVLENQNS